MTLTLLQELLALPNETEWVEFKHNNSAPDNESRKHAKYVPFGA
ncbi:hypothetical protein [Pseudanabaena sp. PCC 6802]|nr:hypothetical protein [Pseudanabaena sp. PCC 6802]